MMATETLTARELPVKKYLVPMTVVALIGIAVGVGIATQDSRLRGKAPMPTQPVTYTAARTTLMNQLNQDFINISRGVTPAVVSISTVAKAQQRQFNPFRQPDQKDQEMYDFFFGHPEGSTPEETPSDGVGSGVIVDGEKGFILTNNHVIEGAANIRVSLPDGRNYRAVVVGTDPNTDLAVIRMEGRGPFTAATLGDSNRLKVGEWVLAIGNPFGLNSSVTAGIISAKGRADVGVADFEDFIQTDAAINPGNSGGALLNIQGEVIGINTAIATRTSGYMGIGFAIPSNMAKHVMTELIEKGKVTRSQLGVMIGAIDEDLRRSLKIPEQVTGILVMDVVPDSPAAKAGFQKYDVITQLQGKPVTDVNHFRNQIALTPPGTQVEIAIDRAGTPQLLKPKLREMPAESATLSADQTVERLGFEAQDLTPELKEQLRLPAGLQGVVVTLVKRGSNAEKRGLKHGDIITELNRKPIASLDAFVTQLGMPKAGDAILLNVIRNGQQMLIAFNL
jgi:serine protease Do